MLTSSQAFKYDIPVLLKFAELSYRNNKIDNDYLSEKTGMNKPKVIENIQYMKFSDLIYNEKISNFGFLILQLKDKPELLEPLLLFKLSRGCKNGGHYYFSRLINNVLYSIAFEFKNIKSRSYIIETALKNDKEAEYCKDNYDTKKKNFVQAFNSGLSDVTTGFGKLGMVLEVDRDEYEITGYIPHKLITAYILYDNWPVNRTALSFNEIITADYLPGKIFFMGQDIILQQIHELAEERIIYTEVEAGLNQIRKNPSLGGNDILERLIEFA